jgi:hypothetical protein
MASLVVDTDSSRPQNLRKTEPKIDNDGFDEEDLLIPWEAFESRKKNGGDEEEDAEEEEYSEEEEEEEEDDRVLDLSGDNISDEGAKDVADNLKVNTLLEMVHLNNNNIGAKGAKYLADALKVNTSVKMI